MTPASEPRGKVWIVGCGPGAADLLTVRAARVIAGADLILHDALVPQEILEHRKEGTRCTRVGRRVGQPGPDLEYVARWMVQEAHRGLTVARLHGGDPAIFGRLAEELTALERGRVDWEIVPGITAAVAAGAVLGVPLTHREVAGGVMIAAGTSDAAIAAAARSRSCTLALYMASRRATEIAEVLIREGRHRDTPVAIICNASLRSQTTELTTLGGLLGVTRRACDGPAILLVGDVLKSTRELQHGRQDAGPGRGGLSDDLDAHTHAAIDDEGRRAVGGRPR